jgi:hypothetical protein
VGDSGDEREGEERNGTEEALNNVNDFSSMKAPLPTETLNS